jgi:NADPH:quinone reductase-like Zn-dependent oxidoreductase
VLKLLARLLTWNALPNGRHAHLFNLWAGRRLRPRHYRAQLASDLSRVLGLLADGAIGPQIARQFPLTQAAAALRYAEPGGITGKVLLIPDDNPTADSPALPPTP